MFSRVYHFLKGPNPLHPSVWKDRLSPIRFRRFEAADLSQCMDLYTLNEKDRFPEGVSEQYRETLVSQKSYHLVCERDGRIIATGGVSYLMRKEIAVLSFGLVHPDYQRRGVGTSLVLARLALLTPMPINYRVFIFAVPKSVPFYRRFGFKRFAPWLDPGGKKNPSGELLLSGDEIHKCRALLEAHHILIPQDQHLIPLRTAAT